ncbi:MAG: endonuclease [Actinomycetota bacterium]|nr:endonuclease [Actinomycetota bacterium]
MNRSDTAARLVSRHGTTWCEEAGIRLADKPSPLWRLLVLSLLLSTRISSEIAVAAARELSRAGMRTPRATARATWQQRVDALSRGGYRRYDERTSTQLGDAAQLLDEDRGDLRRLRVRADGDAAALERELQRFKGVGPTGAAIFCREVQAVWTELSPYVDDLAADGAQRLGLPRGADALARLVPAEDVVRLVAGCVRATRGDAVVSDVRGD